MVGKRIPVCGFEFGDVELKVKNGLTQRALSPNFLLRQLPSPEAGLLVAVFVEPLPEPSCAVSAPSSVSPVELHAVKASNRQT